MAEPERTGRAGEERTPADLTDAERARALRKLVRLLLVGGIVFLAVVSIGLLPGKLGAASPELGRLAARAAWVVAPVLTVSLLVFAALRLRR